MARIIIVEDDLGQQEELQSYLMYAGHEVLAVNSGKELDERLQFVPEIALLDYNLPGETGVEIARRLHAKFGTGIGLGKNPLAYDPRALEANISRLRRKLPPLEDGRNPLQAMRGMGYQFIRPLTVVS